MLSLHKTENSIKVIDIVKGKRKTGEVYWHPTANDKYKNSFENIHDLNDDHFRDLFELSKDQAHSILEGIESDTVVENKKYFHVKRHIKESLLIEMDLKGTAESFEYNFKPKKEFSPHLLVVGNTNSGKSYWLKELCLRNLKGKKENRRKFIVISAQYFRDKTLKELRHEKYHQWVTGIDAGPDGLKNSDYDTPEEFFKNEIQMRVEHAEPGTIVYADDYRDTCCAEQMRIWVDSGLRVFRHLGITLCLVLHSLRSGIWSSQSSNSVGYLVLFPRSQRNKIIQYFNSELAIPLKESRELVRRFAADSRVMMVGRQMPECLIGGKLLHLI